jgi:hypothetical protein
MADLQKLIFDAPAGVSDRQALVAARLTGRVKAFLGRDLEGSVIGEINAAVADEADRLVAEGVLRRRPDWLAVIFRQRLHVAFGSEAVQQLARDLRRMGAW